MYTKKASRLWRNVRLNDKKEFTKRKLTRQLASGKLTLEEFTKVWNSFVEHTAKFKRNNL